MSAGERAAAWVYQGVWSVLAQLFRVPREAPDLPYHDAAAVEKLRPSEAFLRYLKFQFWIVLALIDVAILIAWVVIMFVSPIAGILLSIPALVIAVVPDIIAYIAIHLRFDSTWYVLTDRSMRIRRGIWIIHETTITFENVQNVVVQQGPLQRWFGIADVVVQTAGGGGGGHGKGDSHAGGAHVGLLEGLADAPRVRDLILARIRRARSTGLGDEFHAAAAEPRSSAWTPEHLEVLRGVRDLARALAARSAV